MELGWDSRDLEAVVSWDRRSGMSNSEPIIPRPPERVTAAAKGPPAIPAIGALAIMGVLAQGSWEVRDGILGWVFWE